MWTRSSIGETSENFTIELDFGEELKWEQFSGLAEFFIRELKIRIGIFP